MRILFPEVLSFFFGIVICHDGLKSVSIGKHGLGISLVGKYLPSLVPWKLHAFLHRKYAVPYNVKNPPYVIRGLEQMKEVELRTITGTIRTYSLSRHAIAQEG